MIQKMEPMALSSTKRGTSYWLLFTCVICVSHLCDGFDLFGSDMYTYSTHEEIYATVNSLISIDNIVPFSYYSLPYCTPSWGIRRSSAYNIGQSLMGDEILFSPYRFQMNVNESVFVCTTPPLNKHEVQLLKQRTRELYQVNMIIDSLPVMRVVNQNGIKYQWTGFPVGFSSDNDDDYIINHLKFKILIHTNEDPEVQKFVTGDGDYGYSIVGFEVSPCSFKYEPENMAKLHQYDKLPSLNCPSELEKSQVIREQEQISFTYEVEFVKSETKWASRWDTYVKEENANHWFYILNSLMVIFSLAGIIFIILLSTVRRDLARYEELDKESQAQMNEETSGWKLVVGDVFREPNHSKLLCVVIGDGVQITGMAVFTVIFAALGFISPVSPGMLLTGMIMLYHFLGIGAGYAGVYLHRIIKGTSEGWRSVCWSIACFFPGIVLVIYTALNFILRHSNSTGAIPISLYFGLLLLWLCLSVPLTFLGGYLATRAKTLTYPVRTNQSAREIPARKYPSWVSILVAGTLPFGAVFIEFFFILSSIWLGRFYTAFGFLFIVLLLLVIVCAEVSIVLTYVNLSVEDWQWWWKAFYASGSVSLYVFLYCVYYLVFDLSSLSGAVSVILYLGYSLIIAVAILLSTGTIGFITSFCFVYYLFSSVKFD